MLYETSLLNLAEEGKTSREGNGRNVYGWRCTGTGGSASTLREVHSRTEFGLRPIRHRIGHFGGPLQLFGGGCDYGQVDHTLLLALVGEGDISLQRGRFCARSLAYVAQEPAKTGYRERSSSKLCAAAPVVASSCLEEVRRWFG